MYFRSLNGLEIVSTNLFIVTINICNHVKCHSICIYFNLQIYTYQSSSVSRRGSASAPGGRS